MTYDNYIDESEQERRERLQSGRCCWHCRYYIRQTEGITLDGPQGSICNIDLMQSKYKVSGEMALGEKNEYLIITVLDLKWMNRM